MTYSYFSPPLPLEIASLTTPQIYFMILLYRYYTYWKNAIKLGKIAFLYNPNGCEAQEGAE